MDWLVLIHDREKGEGVFFHDQGELPYPFFLGPAPWPSLRRLDAGDTLWLLTRTLHGSGTRWWLVGNLQIESQGESEPWVDPSTFWLSGKPQVLQKPRRAEKLLKSLSLEKLNGLGPATGWARRLGKPIRLTPQDGDLLSPSCKRVVPLIRATPKEEPERILLSVLERAFGPFHQTESPQGLPAWELPGNKGVRLLTDGDGRLHLLTLYGSLNASFISSLLDAVLLLNARGHSWEVNTFSDGENDSGVAFVFSPQERRS
ncbi:hypothetical protein H8D30_05355 [bacterium]|nr:hypothetical protein [bacterium]